MKMLCNRVGLQSCARALAVCSVLMALAGVAQAQEEGKRYALVIGNNAYINGRLKNPINDARLMKQVLEEAGFKVLYKEDATKTQMDELVAGFAAQLGPEDTALFYYAGHGVQISSANFLVPV